MVPPHELRTSWQLLTLYERESLFFGDMAAGRLSTCAVELRDLAGRLDREGGREGGGVGQLGGEGRVLRHTVYTHNTDKTGETDMAMLLVSQGLGLTGLIPVCCACYLIIGHAQQKAPNWPLESKSQEFLWLWG